MLSEVMEAPLKVPICGQALEPHCTLKQELAALESKYEAVALEHARLANENMMMQHAQLTQANMLLHMQFQIAHGGISPTFCKSADLRPQSLDHTMMTGQMNPWSVPLPPGLAPPCATKQPGQSRMQSELSSQKGLGTIDADDTASLTSGVCTASTSYTSAVSKFGSTSNDEDKPETESTVSSGNTLTTVMMRNIPNNMTRAMLLDIVNGEGFAGSYDFFYLPMDFRSRVGLGYGFINLVDPDVAERFRAHFSGFRCWGLQSEKVCETNWTESIQGRDAHIERYRNSPAMHHSMPHECKPMLFKDGKPMPFPEPTMQIRAPRQFPRKQ